MTGPEERAATQASRRPTRWVGKAVAVVSVLLILLLVLGLEMRRRQGLYWYDTGADYAFTFAGPEVQTVAAQLSSSSLELPSWHADRSSAFVELRVEPRLSARWFEPSIDVLVNEAPVCRQFFERSAAGRRYVDLCDEAGDIRPGDAIHLRAHHLTIPDQDVRVLHFPAPDLSAPVLVLAPHADDAEIAAFGLYAATDSWVVTVTTGSYPGEKYEDLAPDPVEREELQARLRVHDSLVIPQWGGVSAERAVNLGYSTGTLESMFREPKHVIPNPITGSTDIARWRALNRSSLLSERSAQSTWESLVADLASLLNDIQPTIIVAPHPALDAGPDHIYTTAALLEALDGAPLDSLQLLLYTNHHVLSEYYPFGPADAAVTLPPWSDTTVQFRSVYSHWLDSRAQRDKLFALDQMHDLRDAPARVTGGPIMTLLKRIASMGAAIVRDPAFEYSYFRRAARPNELFFVYGISDIDAIRRSVPARDDSGSGAPLDPAATSRD